MIFCLFKKYLIYLILVLGLLSLLNCKNPAPSQNNNSNEDPELNITLQSVITKVQPMTGIVFWTDSEHNGSEIIQLEYSYLLYNDIIKTRGEYNWDKLENLLNRVKNRKHQAVLRFRFTYLGERTSVPEYIKQSFGYHETRGLSEGLVTWFPELIYTCA